MTVQGAAGRPAGAAGETQRPGPEPGGDMPGGAGVAGLTARRTGCGPNAAALPAGELGAAMGRTIPLRPDLQLVADFIPPAARVLDLGCGDGQLLEYLVRAKQVRGRGVELGEAGVLACVRRGLSVRQGNLQEGLADYPDHSFDYVVLSQTLHYLDDPAMILGEMLRVGARAVVSFPNWGYWRCRLHLLATGRVPPAPDLPQRWDERPRWQAFTVTDFATFCAGAGIRIVRQAYLARGRRMRVPKFTNLLSTTAVFTLER